MELMLLRAERFFRTPDGRVWSRWGVNQDTWLPYLGHFSNVKVIARIHEVREVSPGLTLSSHPNVAFQALTPLVGPKGFITGFWKIKRELLSVIDANQEDAILMHSPSPLANLIVPALIRRRRQFAIEVPGDPHGMFAKGAIRHPLRPIFQRWYVHAFKKHCQHASVVRYVTRWALQLRYPPSNSAKSFGFSDVILPDEAYVGESRLFYQTQVSRRLIFVAMLVHPSHKGQDVLLEAVARCVKEMGLNIRLSIVGDGPYRALHEARVKTLGIQDRVEFLGVVPREAIRQELDSSDLFILPSLSEGMPRALLEAMARALPAIATNVGGIPELLPAFWMVPPADVKALADKISAAVLGPGTLTKASRDNLATARTYHDSLRQPQFEAFLEAIRNSNERK